MLPVLGGERIEVVLVRVELVYEGTESQSVSEAPAKVCDVDSLEKGVEQSWLGL